MITKGMQLEDNSNGIEMKKEGILKSTTEAADRFIEWLLLAAVLAVCVVVPLYARDGYHQIGNAKFEVYRRIMTGSLSVLLLLSAVYYICRIIVGRKDFVYNTNSLSGLHLTHRFMKVSLTDKFVLAYLLLAGISVISGGFYEDALWGADGWNMGFLTQASFVLLYLFLSRFGRYYRAVLITLCSVAAVVFAIGILHRLMIDPIGFYDGLTYEQKAQFLSTLGQATWYASFMAVTLPVGIGVFLYAEGIKRRVVSGIYIMLGFCSLVTQNSDSAYFALAGAMFVFFMISCGRKKMLCRFMAVLSMLFAAGKSMYLLTRMRPNPELEPDFVTELMWTSGLTWILLAVCLLLALAAVLGKPERSYIKVLNKRGAADGGMPEQKKGEEFSASAVRRMRRGAAGAAVVLIMLTILVICLHGHGVLPARISDKVSEVSYLNWNDDWGNGRGRIWSFSCKMISEESLGHRFFGVGPDCFNSYAKAYHRDEVRLLWGEKLLTNAHNEWLTMLINGGILGAAAYVGIYVTAVGRFLRGCRQNYLLMGIAASCVSYMCYNFFCYQQVLCTPFIFILMGIGEYILRQRA